MPEENETPDSRDSQAQNGGEPENLAAQENAENAGGEADTDAAPAEDAAVAEDAAPAGEERGGQAGDADDSAGGSAGEAGDPGEVSADAPAQGAGREEPGAAGGDSSEESSGGGGAAELPEFEAPAGSAQQGSIDLLMDVDLEVRVELGRADMAIEDILRLKKGSVVELDKLAGDPVDIIVNEKLVARGEILVVNDNFSIRVTDIFDPKVGLTAGEEKDE